MKFLCNSKTTLSIMALLLFCTFSCDPKKQAQEKAIAYEINGKKILVADLYNKKKAEFYELEVKKADLIRSLAEEAYTADFFEGLAKTNKTTSEKAKEDYIASKSKVEEIEIKMTLQRFANHPRLKDLPEEQKRKQVLDYLTRRRRQEVIGELINKAVTDKKLVFHYKKPQAPKYDITIDKGEPVRYGPTFDDTKPMGCTGDGCKITVVEYSEFQCPFCARVLPTANRLLKEYKGKVRWIVRDFPLDFHKRAKPAAIAAKCAHEQGKYWHMYEILFNNMRKLEDADLSGYAEKIGLDMTKYKTCMENPAKYEKTIAKNIAAAASIGVKGTPAFFINGRKISGALPYKEFKELFDAALKE